MFADWTMERGADQVRRILPNLQRTLRIPTCASRCVPRTCGLPRAPRNGDIECMGEGGDNSTTGVGAMCVASCRPGFRLGGSRRRTCLPLASWSGVSPYCRREHLIPKFKPRAFYCGFTKMIYRDDLPRPGYLGGVISLLDFAPTEFADAVPTAQITNEITEMPPILHRLLICISSSLSSSSFHSPLPLNIPLSQL